MKEKLALDISVIVPIVERYDDLDKLHSEYSEAFDKLGKSYEFIFVVDGDFDEAFEALKRIKDNQPTIKIIKLAKSFGESTALTVGLDVARGTHIFTLSAYFQVVPESVSDIWKHLESGYDLVITRRHPRIDSPFNRLQSYMFHWLIWKITSVRFHDISCGLKGMKRKVLDEIDLYGDLHRFIPILAHENGFKIKELKVRQREEDSGIRLIRIGAYFRRLLDIFTVFFISKFTMKPLRFFGLIGLWFFGAGSLITASLGAYRILGFGGIADKPLLLLGVIGMVLGVQAMSIGLIGEMIIFTHARNVKEYNVEVFLTNDETEE